MSEIDVERTGSFLIDSDNLKIEFDESKLDCVCQLEKLESAVIFLEHFLLVDLSVLILLFLFLL